MVSAKGVYVDVAGMTFRNIWAHLLDLYGLKISPDLISRVANAVLDEVRDWQGRALERMYPKPRPTITRSGLRRNNLIGFHT